MLEKGVIWGLIALFLTNQIAGNTIDFKMNVIRVVIITLKISIRALLKYINHVTKFLSKNLLACLQDETSSFRLFKVARDGWQRMKYFSHKRKLHLFESLL